MHDAMSRVTSCQQCERPSFCSSAEPSSEQISAAAQHRAVSRSLVRKCPPALCARPAAPTRGAACAPWCGARGPACRVRSSPRPAAAQQVWRELNSGDGPMAENCIAASTAWCSTLWQAGVNEQAALSVPCQARLWHEACLLYRSVLDRCVQHSRRTHPATKSTQGSTDLNPQP